MHIFTLSEYVMVPLFDDGCGIPPDDIKKVFAIMLIGVSTIKASHISFVNSHYLAICITCKS